MNDGDKIVNAIDQILKYGSIDGSLHKQWLLDRVLRILTECPIVTKTAIDCNGDEYSYADYGESGWYKNLIGEDWDEGIAP